MQYLKKFNEGFFDFLKPKVKKDSFTKKEVDTIYSRISKMINSPFIVRDIVISNDSVYMFNIEIISNIPITTKISAEGGGFYFNDIKIPTIYISLTKSTIGKKTEYYISNVSNFLSNWIEPNNTWTSGYFDYHYIEKYESIDRLLNGIVEYNRLFIISYCLNIKEVQHKIGFINLKDICNDYSIFNRNIDISRFRISDMVDELNDDYDIIPKLETGLVVSNLKNAGFNII